MYFDPTIAVEEKIIFSKYVHEHLLQKAHEVVRLRHYVCPHCATPVGNREVAMKRLEAWLEKNVAAMGTTSQLKGWRGKPEQPTIICAECEKRVPLWDELEQHFASPETKQRVRELEEQSALVLDNESKERALVGEVISTVALAGQLCTIKNARHARYWMAQAFPVLLVIRNAKGEVRWMEVRDYLKQASDNGKKPVKQIVFAGERFDVISVRGWRDRAFHQEVP